MYKIKVLKYSITQTIVLAFFGLLAGILYSFGGLLIDSLVTFEIITSNETPGLSPGTALAFLALIGMPLYFAAFGFISGLIGATLFNILTPKKLRKFILDNYMEKQGTRTRKTLN